MDPENPKKILDHKTRVVKISAPVQILIIETRTDSSTYVSDFLKKLIKPVKAKVNTVSISSDVFDNMMKEAVINDVLKPYDLIIFYNLPGSFFKENHVETLEQYVRREAGGLLFIGGSSSFEYGGYENNNNLMELLPVKIGEPVTYLRSGLFVFVLDVSGSMKGTKLDALKPSVLNTINSIPADGINRVAIYIFDTSPTELIDKVLISKDDQEIFRKVQDLKAEGGTKLLPALKAAIGKAEAFLEKNQMPNIGAKIYIYSDDELNEKLQDIEDALTGIDSRIQLSTFTINNSPKTMAFVS